MSQAGEPVELILRISSLDSYVLTLNIAKFTELSQE
jgi:hypothetical protein